VISGQHTCASRARVQACVRAPARAHAREACFGSEITRFGAHQAFSDLNSIFWGEKKEKVCFEIGERFSAGPNKIEFTQLFGQPNLELRSKSGQLDEIGASSQFCLTY